MKLYHRLFDGFLIDVGILLESILDDVLYLLHNFFEHGLCMDLSLILVCILVSFLMIR